MPYILATRRSAKRLQPGQSTYDETAVATLDEARLAVDDLCWADRTLPRPLPNAIPESGGTVGPLPDGTVIEVRQVGWSALAEDLHANTGDMTCGEVLAAFNAA